MGEKDEAKILGKLVSGTLAEPGRTPAARQAVQYEYCR
jgi:hypothetical protein